VFEAHRLMYHSTLGLSVIKKKKKNVVVAAHRAGSERKVEDGPARRSVRWSVTRNLSTVPFACPRMAAACQEDSFTGVPRS